MDASGRIGERGSRAEVRAQETDSRSQERVDQFVQTFDGGRATVLLGASRPTRQRQYIETPAGRIPQEVTVVQEQTRGVDVVPRLMGGGRVQVEAGNTRASGRLGEWFELGAIATPEGTRTMRIRVDEIR